jgi:hypothetical protein
MLENKGEYKISLDTDPTYQYNDSSLPARPATVFEPPDSYYATPSLDQPTPLVNPYEFEPADEGEQFYPLPFGAGSSPPHPKPARKIWWWLGRGLLLVLAFLAGFVVSYLFKQSNNASPTVTAWPAEPAATTLPVNIT